MAFLFSKKQKPRPGPVYLSTRDTSPSQLIGLPPMDAPDSQRRIHAAANATEQETGLFKSISDRFFKQRPRTNFSN